MIPRLFLVCLLLTATGGCSEKKTHIPGGSLGNQAATITHDFGKVVIDAGPQRLTHVFRIANSKDQAVELADLKKSCGCVEAAVSKNRLEPGDVADVSLGFEVKTPGQNSQTATLFWSDGANCSFILKAYGSGKFEMSAIPVSFNRESGVLAIRLYVIDSEGDGETEAPSIVTPPGVNLSFEGWKTLEDHRTEPRRPTRQVANAAIDLSGYTGKWPVDLVFQARLGATTKLQIGDRPAPQCD